MVQNHACLVFPLIILLALASNSLGCAGREMIVTTEKVPASVLSQEVFLQGHGRELVCTQRITRQDTLIETSTWEVTGQNTGYTIGGLLLILSALTAIVDAENLVADAAIYGVPGTYITWQAWHAGRRELPAVSTETSLETHTEIAQVELDQCYLPGSHDEFVESCRGGLREACQLSETPFDERCALVGQCCDQEGEFRETCARRVVIDNTPQIRSLFSRIDTIELELSSRRQVAADRDALLYQAVSTAVSTDSARTWRAYEEALGVDYRGVPSSRDQSRLISAYLARHPNNAGPIDSILADMGGQEQLATGIAQLVNEYIQLTERFTAEAVQVSTEIGHLSVATGAALLSFGELELGEQNLEVALQMIQALLGMERDDATRAAAAIYEEIEWFNQQLN